MSIGMDRDTAELLTTKEKEEEEEMKRELLDMKMYESWYTYKDMKQILGFINESKDMANMVKDQKNVQKELLETSNESTSELMSKSNLAHELEIQEHNDLPRLVHPHRSSHAPSILLDQIPSHNHSSPELAPSNTDSRSSAYRSKHLDIDDMFDRLHDNLNTRDSYAHSLNRYVSLKSKNSLQDSHSTHNAETKMDVHMDSNRKLEKWQINPLDSCVNENDVPLREPERPVVPDRMPYKLWKDPETSETLEKLVVALNVHLKQTAELWHSWHRTADSKFQWGSPIQVDLAKGSWDRKSLTNSKTEENRMELRTSVYNSERPNKRKSTLVFSSRTTHSSSDEDEKIVKKKKTHSYERPSRVLRSHKEVCVNPGKRNLHLDDDDSSQNIGNVETLGMEREKHESVSPVLLSSHSRKITPPNTRMCIKKKKHNISILANGPSEHNSGEKQNAISLDSKEKSSMLTDEEILLELEKDNVANDIKRTEKSTEIKPLPLRGLSRRIKNECMILEKIQKDKQKKIEVEKEEAQRRENEEKKKREEFYKKQTEERQQRERLREKREISREEKSKRWNSIVNMKAQRRVSEESRENVCDLLKQNENETLLLDNSLVTEKVEITKDYSSNNVSCPICNQYFPSDVIETHAAGCEQYISDGEDEMNITVHRSKTLPLPMNAANNEEILECGVCLEYKTTNNAQYEQHVKNCLQKRQQGESSPECTSTEIDNIINSPIRCYRPISEQADSEIDYRRQFPSNSRTKIRATKKRKH